MITISNLSKSYLFKNQTTQVLSNINLEIKSGEIFGLFGKSGAGKSTLLRTLNGFEHPTTGTVTVLGKQISSLSKSELQSLRRNIGVIFQNYNLIHSLTVFQNIALPLECLNYSKAEIEDKVKTLLNLVQLENKTHTKPGLLSGGERQRVAIARALATQPKILLCDEPTSALDQTTSKNILNLLTKINQSFGTTIIIISHDESAVKPHCHRFANLNNGKLMEVTHVH